MRFASMRLLPSLRARNIENRFFSQLFWFLPVPILPTAILRLVVFVPVGFRACPFLGDWSFFQVQSLLDLRSEPEISKRADQNTKNLKLNL